MRTLIYTLALTILAPAFASAEDGYLLLRRLDGSEIRDGVAHADLWVYDADGVIVAPPDGQGGWSAGTNVPVEAGWYYVQVGQYRTEHNIQKLYVAPDEVTVVPAGSISVLTVPVSEQPAQGCQPWNAELTVFALDDGSGEHLINTNRGSGIRDFGMVQAPAGTVRVHFNGIPNTVDVQPGEEYQLPLGYQDPLGGDRGQLALYPEGTEPNVRISLCDDGALHVPAGSYWASAIVSIPQYPFERREWNPVNIPPHGAHGYLPVEQERLEHDRYEGDGAFGAPLTAEDAEALERIASGGLSGGAGGGPRLQLGGNR